MTAGRSWHRGIRGPITADARAEADRLKAEGVALYDAATDAIDAWRRAEDRALLAQQLAGQAAGGYNVWDRSPA
jgi:hypothetical protein